MALKDIKRRESVTAAMRECDAMGRDDFLKAYGFGKARAYQLVVNERRYDSKAILGVAHGHEFGRPLKSSEFSGGYNTVRRKLVELGFEVEVVPQ